MTTKKQIALKYLDYLAKGDSEEIIKLFDKNAIVDSPIYGIMKADEFYNQLTNDTSNSELELKGVFEENDSNKLALYFGYRWTLRNKEEVEFDVVDIIEFDSLNTIHKLKIIYDTSEARKLVNKLKK